MGSPAKRHESQPSMDPLFPPLGNKQVHVWRVDLTEDLAGSTPEALGLSAAERRRAAGYAHPHRATQFLVGRAAVRQLLSRYLTLDPGQIALESDASGKPRLAGEQGRSGICFNLSHSRDLVVCAFARWRQLGVDVEFKRSGIDVERLAHRFFAPREAAQLRRTDGTRRLDAFYVCWTQKEACLKAAGLGLAGGLRRFSVPLDAAPGPVPVPLLAAEKPLREQDWHLATLDLGAGYAAALCAEGGDWCVRVADWDIRSGVDGGRPGSVDD